MAKVVQIKGVKNVAAKLKAADKKMQAKYARGLRLGGAYLQRQSQKEVPIQFGNLRGSAFTRPFGKGVRTDVVVGYTALYAAYVHEDQSAAHGAAFNLKYATEIAKYGGRHKTYFRRGENQKAKFLEDPAKAKRPEILAIIARSMGTI